MDLDDNWIETYLGGEFWSHAPRAQDVKLLDIAHSLSLKCRFNGHSRVFYSVAEHSVRVSRLLAQWNEPLAVQRWGLLHDACETWFPDVPSPLKASERYACLREDEKRIQNAVCDAFNLHREEPNIVKRADRVLLATEARDLMQPGRWLKWKLDAMPLPETITPWSMMQAEQAFLHLAIKLALR